MSKGIGALQRRILAVMHAQERPFGLCTSRELVAHLLAEDHVGDLTALVKRVRSMDRAVRRALRGLEARGLVVGTGRMKMPRHSERAVSSYATPEGSIEIAQGLDAWQTHLGRRGKQGGQATSPAS